MDRRAYTVDPNSERSATSAPSWWQEIGPTTRDLLRMQTAPGFAYRILP